MHTVCTLYDSVAYATYIHAKIAVLAGVQANVYTLSYNCDVIARELQYICKRVVFTL